MSELKIRFPPAGLAGTGPGARGSQAVAHGGGGGQSDNTKAQAAAAQGNNNASNNNNITTNNSHFNVSPAGNAH
jgi:hypothetical protein